MILEKRAKIEMQVMLASLHNGLMIYPLFLQTEKIMPIVTRVVVDDTILCYDAITIGKRSMAKIENMPLTNIKLSQKDRALPLTSMNSMVKINNEKVVVDPFLLFQQISISKKSAEGLKKYMQYELAPYPLAFFNESGMRKCRKSVLYTFFEEIDLTTFKFVIDGGFLVHKVVCQKDKTDQ